MSKQISVLVPCQLKYRDTIGAMVTQVCHELEELGEDETFGYQVLSAFNEAFNNLVLHEHSGRTDRQVLINIDVRTTQLVLELQDDSAPFDFAASGPVSLELLRQSGMGLEIMRAFMSSVEYSPGQGGKANVLRLVRQRSAARTETDTVE